MATGGDSDLALVIRLIDNASKDLASINKSLDDVGTAAQRNQSHVSALQKGLGAIGGAAATAAKVGIAAVVAGAGAVAVGLGSAVGAAMDFESTMSGVKAASNATAEEMKALHDEALRIGKDTAWSATEAAEGMEELVKAGVSVEDIMAGAAQATADLASAASTDLKNAAEIASTVMNTFGKSGDEMAAVADRITGAVNASAIDINDFKFSMAAAGSVANLMGISFEETATAIAMLGAAGLKGSDAGTSLKTMLINLVPSTNAARDTMRQLGLFSMDTARVMDILTKGIEGDDKAMKAWGKAQKEGKADLDTLFDIVKKFNPEMIGAAKNASEWAHKQGEANSAFFDAEGKILPLRDILQKLYVATKDLGKEQQIMAVMTIFGTDAIRAEAILAKLGAGAFDEMEAAIVKQGDAQRVAKERMDNLKGSLEMLSGTWDTLKVMLGEKFLPVLKSVVDKFNEFLGQHMDDIAAFGGQFAIWIEQTAVPALQDLVTWLGTNLPPALDWLTNTGWPALQGTIGAIAGFITEQLIPKLWELYQWLDVNIRGALDWLTNTGWPGLQNALSGTVEPADNTRNALDLINVQLERMGIISNLSKSFENLRQSIDNFRVAIENLTPRLQEDNAELDAQNKLVLFLRGAVDSLLMPFTIVTKAWEVATGWLLALSEAVKDSTTDLGALVEVVKLMPQPFSTVGIILEQWAGWLSAIKTKAEELWNWLQNHPFSFNFGGFGGGTNTRTASFVPGGGALSGENLVSYIYEQFAGSMGEMAGRIAASIVRSEGSLFGEVGDSGTSFGPFQFHQGGQLNAFAAWLNASLEEAARVATERPDIATTFAMQTYLGSAIRAGMAAGLTGADLAYYVAQWGQVTAYPQRAADAYTTMYGTLNSQMTTNQQALAAYNTALVDNGTTVTGLPPAYAAADQALLRAYDSMMGGTGEFSATVPPTFAQAMDKIQGIAVASGEKLTTTAGRTWEELVRSSTTSWEAMNDNAARVWDQISKKTENTLDDVVGDFNEFGRDLERFGRGVERQGERFSDVLNDISDWDNFREYQAGGYVTGPVGRPQLALVHGGEYVVPVGGRGPATITVGSIVVNGASDPQATARAIRDELIRMQRRGSPVAI